MVKGEIITKEAKHGVQFTNSIETEFANYQTPKRGNRTQHRVYKRHFQLEKMSSKSASLSTASAIVDTFFSLCRTFRKFDSFCAIQRRCVPFAILYFCGFAFIHASNGASTTNRIHCNNNNENKNKNNRLSRFYIAVSTHVRNWKRLNVI